ncbi:hypothetical protein LB579_31835 [Mesorhizobium sp. BR1-1-7]|uniref:DUF7940 domain-containing protein n=1 Tax=Mesorhizobium sp. BR1-1-7 TaxID=2876647 RepID=UPI001CCC7E35|nr:hypothetical protein [Mesorhizobium sp. BR1-1-7]MBZ9922269.1 hypothetical protein [Mesorhizobium sp. BR1-1-7]
MRLIDDWKAVLRHAWSVRLLFIAAVLSGLEVALPLLNGLLPVPPLVFAALSGLCVCAAFVARFVVQKKLSGKEDP